MSLTRITSDLIKDGTVAVADLASATKTAISGSSASGSVSTRTTALETASGSFSTRITNATASINSISSSQATRTANLVIASSSLSSSVATLKGSGTLQSVATNASPTFAGATITGTLTAQEVHTEFTSASIIFSSGSTIFGDTTDDTHLFSGSVSIHNGEVGVAAGGSADELVIKNNGDAGISVLSPDGNSSRIQFGSVSDNDIGHIGGYYNSGNEYLFFSVDGSARMVIGGATNAGNVGIGTDNPVAKLDVNGSALVGRDRDIGSYASDDFDLMVTNANNDATAILLYNDAGAYQSSLIEYYNNKLSLGLNNSNSDDTLLTTTAINITSTGVGIGTATPTAELTVIGQISGSNTIKAGQIADDGKAFMADVVDGGAFNVLEITENGNFRWSLVFEGNAAENALTINSNAQSNIANIEPDGSIYLGVQQSTLQKNSSHRLNVQGPASTGAWISTFANNSYPAINLYRTNNTTIGSYSATANNDPIGAINWYGSSASAHTLGASIDVRQDGTASTNTPTRMDFYVSPGGNISNSLLSLDGPTQRVGIGANMKTPEVVLDVKGGGAGAYVARFDNDADADNAAGIEIRAGNSTNSGTTTFLLFRESDGGEVGQLRTDSGTLQLQDASDVSLKKNIRDTEIKGLNTLNALQVRDFEWKKSEETVIGGFVAQEVSSSYNQAVGAPMEDGLYGVAQNKFIPLLVKAVQELSTEVNRLQAQISGSSDFNALKTMVSGSN